MLYEDDGVKTLGQVRAIVRNGIFAAGGFTKNGTAHCHDWYQVEVLAYFNGPWQQPSEVMAVVGTDGVNLAGRFSEAVHPDLDDSSEQVLRARFKVIAPVLTNTHSLTDAQLKSAIELTKGARLTIGGRLSGETIEGGIALFFRSGALREKDGWAAAERADGSVRVEYSFWNGTEPAVAHWVVLLEPVRVNCMNVYAKYFSDVPND